MFELPFCQSFFAPGALYFHPENPLLARRWVKMTFPIYIRPSQYKEEEEEKKI
jgi:hypothetical protein